MERQVVITGQRVGQFVRGDVVSASTFDDLGRLRRLGVVRYTVGSAAGMALTWPVRMILNLLRAAGPSRRNGDMSEVQPPIDSESVRVTRIVGDDWGVSVSLAPPVERSEQVRDDCVRRPYAAAADRIRQRVAKFIADDPRGQKLRATRQRVADTRAEIEALKAREAELRNLQAAAIDDGLDPTEHERAIAELEREGRLPAARKRLVAQEQAAAVARQECLAPIQSIVISTQAQIGVEGTELKRRAFETLASIPGIGAAIATWRRGQALVGIADEPFRSQGLVNEFLDQPADAPESALVEAGAQA